MKQQHLLEQAIYIALQAHKGKVDRGGSPYILHPLRVMFAMDTNEEKMVAILHDVVEDSIITLRQLEDAKFSKKILAALSLLTKKENQEYQDYILAIKKNPLAVKVKLADLKDNMNIKRLKKITDTDKQRIQKYKAAFKLLTAPNYS